jgi:S1-C subfamily serine protease
LTLALAGAARAQSPVVNCYDEARGIVTPTMAADCKGRAVDDAEAARIKRAREDRIRAGIAARENAIFPGTRLRKTGTAFFFAEDGSLLSNAHVTRDCPMMTVETPDGRRARGRVVATSDELDLALIASDEAPTAVARFSRDDIAPGARADLIGYPTQGIAPEKPIFSAGSVAREQARYRHPFRFMIEADVRSGNSGGPVLDERGQVLGVVFAQLDVARIREKTGRMLPDIALAIRNRAVFDFLTTHGAGDKMRVDTDAPVLDREAVQRQARDFVARIACWR